MQEVRAEAQRIECRVTVLENNSDDVVRNVTLPLMLQMGHTLMISFRTSGRWRWRWDMEFEQYIRTR
jgi:hypothetical protein